MNGCLYQIAFPNGKSYIGVTKGTVECRFRKHKARAAMGEQGALCAAIRKHGVDGVTARALVVGSWPYVLEMEKAAIVAYQTKTPSGYNLTDGGEGVRGLTDEARERIAAGQRGRECPASTKAAVATAQRGRIHTAEHRAKVGAASRGTTWSAERIAKRTATRRAKNNGAYHAS